MSVIGQIPVRQGGSTVLIPVVSLGESPLTSKLRARIGGKTGELPLVYPDDNRASKIRVRQGNVTYCVAKDARTEITHTGITITHNRREYSEKSATVGKTTFNRVTQIEATLKVGIRWNCTTWSLLSPYHTGYCWGWISVSGTTSATSEKIAHQHGENHDIASSNFWTKWYYKTGTVKLTLPPGSYTVTLWIAVNTSQNHDGLRAYGSVELVSWKEIARG